MPEEIIHLDLSRISPPLSFGEEFFISTEEMIRTIAPWEFQADSIFSRSDDMDVIKHTICFNLPKRKEERRKRKRKKKRRAIEEDLNGFVFSFCHPTLLFYYQSHGFLGCSRLVCIGCEARFRFRRRIV